MAWFWCSRFGPGPGWDGAGGSASVQRLLGVVRTLAVESLSSGLDACLDQFQILFALGRELGFQFGGALLIGPEPFLQRRVDVFQPLGQLCSLALGGLLIAENRPSLQQEPLHEFLHHPARHVREHLGAQHRGGLLRACFRGEGAFTPGFFRSSVDDKSLAVARDRRRTSSRARRRVKRKSQADEGERGDRESTEQPEVDLQGFLGGALGLRGFGLNPAAIQIGAGLNALGGSAALQFVEGELGFVGDDFALLDDALAGFVPESAALIASRRRARFRRVSSSSKMQFARRNPAM